jgi:Flp pilus assembly pilin Flp
MAVAPSSGVHAVAGEKVTAIRTHADRASNTRRENVMKWMDRLLTFVRKDDAQDLIEYALLVGLISLVAVAALTLTGTNVNAIFNSIQAKLAAAA